MSACLYGCAEPTRCDMPHADCHHCREARATLQGLMPFDHPDMKRILDDARAERDAAKAELDELRATFKLRWDADMRAIKRWQAAHPGSELTWPDHADLVVWLMGELDAHAHLEGLAGG